MHLYHDAIQYDNNWAGNSLINLSATVETWIIIVLATPFSDGFEFEWVIVMVEQLQIQFYLVESRKPKENL